MKALMVDVDGVVVRTPLGGWAANLEADLGISTAALQAQFFKPHWPDVVLGKADLHERLAPVLAEHAPHLTSHQLTAYWFEKDARLDEMLLTGLAALRLRGIQLHLATVQEHYRAAHLWTTLSLKDRFDAMHYSADLGAKKPDPAFYAAVERKTGYAPGELFLIDDTPANIEAARAAGWGAALWDGTVDLFSLLDRRGAVGS